jgi:hypothetical protein
MTGLVHGRRPRVDVVAMALLPVAISAALAMALFGQIRPGGSPSAGRALELVPDVASSVRSPLPRSDADALVQLVGADRRQSYTCVGPYTSTGQSLKWACRTPASLVVLVARRDRRVTEVDLTVFGFDARTEELEAWARAVQTARDVGDQAAEWVRTASRPEEKVVGSVVLQLGGSRGATSLGIVAK